MPVIQPNLRIRTGVYMGECVGYCYQDMTITSDDVMYIKYALPRDPSWPDIVHQVRMGADEWNKLVQDLDLQAFWALPRTIGEPDAADQGGEWVEITDGDRVKRVDFVLGAEIPEISSFLEKLRKLRTQISE